MLWFQSAITAYCKDLVDQGTQDLVDSWSTQTLPITPDLETPFMRVIMLPDLPNYPQNPVRLFFDCLFIHNSGPDISIQSLKSYVVL